MRIEHTVIVDDEHFPTFTRTERVRYADVLMAELRACYPDDRVTVEVREYGLGRTTIDDDPHGDPDTVAAVRYHAEQLFNQPERWADPT